jgi:hypothetical protein
MGKSDAAKTSSIKGRVCSLEKCGTVLGAALFHLLFASENVDDFVVAEAHDFNKFQ